MGDIQEPETILVVEDESLLRWHATELLTEHGYAVVEAEDAASALRILEQRSDVRLLFTDIQMPGGSSGIDLARQVHERWPKVLLLVTSGGVIVADEDLPDDGKFVAKPYRDADILDRVDAMVQKV